MLRRTRALGASTENLDTYQDLGFGDTGIQKRELIIGDLAFSLGFQVNRTADVTSASASS